MTDIALADNMLIWDRSPPDPERPALKVVERGGRDDRSYTCSWGCCNAEFDTADDADKLRMLLAKSISIVIIDRVQPKAIHEALLVIPEYRNAFEDIAPCEMIPDRYREEA